MQLLRNVGYEPGRDVTILQIGSENEGFAALANGAIDAGVVPPPLDAWFVRALHREPAQRFASAKEMAIAFVHAIPPGCEDLEEEMLDTGVHFLPAAPQRPPTAIGIGDGQLLPPIAR